MSESKDESKDETKEYGAVGISDDQLPEDLVPSEDNPLAEGLPDGETADSAEDKRSDDDEPDNQS